MDERRLPLQFGELETFLDWSLATERERTDKRHSSSMGDIRAFYDALVSHLEEILKLLDRYSVDEAPADVRRLFLMTLSLAEIAPAIENFGQPGVIDGYDFLRFIPAEQQ